jgi:magnesium-transporting ATPase (P-type)
MALINDDKIKITTLISIIENKFGRNIIVKCYLIPYWYFVLWIIIDLFAIIEIIFTYYYYYYYDNKNILFDPILNALIALIIQIISIIIILLCFKRNIRLLNLLFYIDSNNSFIFWKIRFNLSKISIQTNNNENMLFDSIDEFFEKEMKYNLFFCYFEQDEV